jgi:hypothetical protein
MPPRKRQKYLRIFDRAAVYVRSGGHMAVDDDNLDAGYRKS